MARGGSQRIPRPERTRPGRDPVWLGRTDLAAVVDEAKVRELAAVPAGAPDHDLTNAREAAVLMPAYRTPTGATGLVLVRRRDDSPTHAGEVAFPGGMRAAHDVDLWATAVREAHEETGLAPSLVSPIAARTPVSTFIATVAVTPWLAWAHDVTGLRPQESEIARVLHVDLDELVDNATYVGEEWFVAGAWRPMHRFLIEGETIWGMTARILVQFLDELLGPESEVLGS